MKILDSIQIFLDGAEESDKNRVYGSFGKILAVLGMKHALFKQLLSFLKKSLSSNDSDTRLKSLTIFQIFVKHLSEDEVIGFSMRYLADSNKQVRVKAKEMLILNGVLDFAISNLKQKQTLSSSRIEILETCKLPSIHKLGLLANVSSELSNNFEDKYNISYYSSETGKKLCSRYGLGDSMNLPLLPQSVFNIIDEKTMYPKKPSLETIKSYQLLLNLDVTSILQECIKKYPQQAQVIVEANLESLEGKLNNRGLTNHDETLENEVHSIDVLNNILFAIDGSSDKILAYISRLKDFIVGCNLVTRNVREELYNEIDESFFFFNDYVDVPIISDEQFAALEKLKNEKEEATLEIVKSGKVDKLIELEARKGAINEGIDGKTAQLLKLTNMALHAISGYCVYHAISGLCPESAISSAIKFLSDLILENEHR